MNPCSRGVSALRFSWWRGAGVTSSSCALGCPDRSRSYWPLCRNCSFDLARAGREGRRLVAPNRTTDSASSIRSSSQVFVDERGRRAKYLRRGGAALGALLLAYLVLLGTGFFGTPWVPSISLPFFGKALPEKSGTSRVDSSRPEPSAEAERPSSLERAAPAPAVPAQAPRRVVRLARSPRLQPARVQLIGASLLLARPPTQQEPESKANGRGQRPKARKDAFATRPPGRARGRDAREGPGKVKAKEHGLSRGKGRGASGSPGHKKRPAAS